uniref:EGF-like domain-containing protein n=1 Tax=Hanusia phi TaxID=3032 RepID=A0A7S0EW27_9CRYP|mmetsp:Transcript_33/g.90  ORF Transcript_33/g.90 Transcript_33/m.90 type:complete len:595 (+) Transcript_33:73-1857(+)
MAGRKLFPLVLLLLVQTEPDSRRAHALPSVLFDHPPQDFTFAPLDENETLSIVLALRGLKDPSWKKLTVHELQRVWTPWHVVVELDAVEVGRWRATELMNAFGEVSVHLPVLDLQDGEHVACCRLVNDTAEFEELEHTISFWVRHDCVETDRGWRRRELSVLHEREAEVDEAEEEITLRFQTIMTDECEESDACKSDEDCNKHGTCVRGGCLCESDWAGETCQHAILSQMRFLPDRDPSASPSRCIKAIAWEQGVDLLRKRMERLSNICDKPDVNLDKIKDHLFPFGPPAHGFGFNLHYVSHIFAMSMENNQIAVMIENEHLGRWLYGDVPQCDEKGWSCLLKPISSCDRFAPLMREGYRVHSRADGIPEKSLNTPADLQGELPALRPHGKLWWRAQLVQQLLQPSSFLQALLRRIRNSLGIVEPYMSVHVRMGDSCTHTARYANVANPPEEEGCVEIDRYLLAVQHFSSRYGIRRIYLATDSEEAKRRFEETDYEVYSLNLDRHRLFNSTWLIEHRIATRAMNVSLVALSSLVDVFLLSAGDYFVGSFGGHMSRLAFELMVGRKGFLVPYESVDRPWCFESDRHYGTGFIDFC